MGDELLGDRCQSRARKQPQKSWEHLFPQQAATDEDFVVIIISIELLQEEGEEQAMSWRGFQQGFCDGGASQKTG